MDSTFTYALVCFVDEEDSLGILCTKWMSPDHRTSLFPNVKSNEARDSLLKKVADPMLNWSSCRVKVLHYYMTFQEAHMKLARAEDTSNLETEDEVDEPRKRRIRNIVLPGEEEHQLPFKRQAKKPFPCSLPLLESYPNPPNHSSSFIPSNETRFEPSPSEVRGFDPSPSTVRGLEQSPPVRGFEPSPSPARQFDPSPSPVRFTPIAAYSSPPMSDQSQHAFNATCCCGKQNINNGRIIAWMSDMSSAFKGLEAKVDRLLGEFTSRVQDGQQSEETLTLIGQLPLQHDAEMDNLNIRLKSDKECHQAVTKVLIAVGGKDMRSLVQNMLRRLMSDDVAELYSLKGKSTLKNVSKKMFVGTATYNLILVACQKVFDDSTEFKVREAVGDWLHQAKVRRIRRIQRQEKAAGPMQAIEENGGYF